MYQIDKSRLDMLVRVRNFGAGQARLIPETSPAHAAFAAIATEVDLLEALDVKERTASQAAGAARKQVARRALVNTLTRAGATARVVARASPALEAQIDVPLPSDDQLLLTVARQFAAGAAPWAATFADHGIQLVEVEGRIAGFEQALQERQTARDERVRLRAEIDASFRRAMDAVAVLDVSVANGLVTDPAALAVWKHQRRIAYPRGRRGATAPEPGPTPEPVVEAPVATTVTPPSPAV